MGDGNPYGWTNVQQANPAAFKGTKLRSRREIFAILDQAIEDDLDPAKVHAM